LNSNQKNPNFAILKEIHHLAKKSLPTNALIYQRVSDVAKLAMIDLVKFGYKLKMDVILWNSPLKFWLPALSQCFFSQVCEVKVGNRCQKNLI